MQARAPGCDKCGNGLGQREGTVERNGGRRTSAEPRRRMENPTADGARWWSDPADSLDAARRRACSARIAARESRVRAGREEPPRVAAGIGSNLPAYDG